MVAANTEALLVQGGVEHHLQERTSDPYVTVDRCFPEVRLIRGRQSRTARGDGSCENESMSGSAMERGA